MKFPQFPHEDFILPTKCISGLSLLFGVVLLGCGHSSPAQAPLTGPVPPTKFGINLTAANSRGQRAFANLAIGDGWKILGTGKDWTEFPTEYILPDGGLAALPPGANAARFLAKPYFSERGAEVRCKWEGKAQVIAKGAPLSNLFARSNQLSFHWNDSKEGVWLQVLSLDAAHPIRNVDCRESSMLATARFDPEFVKLLTGYSVLRFMDWQRTNQNLAVTWATRTAPNSIETGLGGGVSIEDMVALATATRSAPWFCMPWNADDDYVERFARYVHDTLPADQSVYVEVGNEIWNAGFAASKQAISEGLTKGLADNPKEAHLFRLAERTVEVMKIWEKVFADRPKRLVRIISTQHVTPDSAGKILARGDTAAHVDALATAPYFGYELMKEGQTTDLTEIFRRLNADVDHTIDTAVANRAVAAKYGKRYIAYEAGQHVVVPYNVPLTIEIQRDPRMYATYKHYIDAWRSRVGDTIAMFADVGGIRTSGAWGLAEYSGQPLSQAPKLRAVLEERDR
ncbi:hypothetical protein BH11PSE5_BH11PSE5_10900 [soil metagenome]